MAGTGTILDPQAQQSFVSQLPVQQFLPDSSQQPQTTTGGAADLSLAGMNPAPSGTEELESLRGQRVDMTGHLLRDAQQQNLQLQGQVEQAQQQLNDPFNRIANDLANRYDELRQQRSTGIKGMLRNFFGGMGQSMMHDAGLPTEYDQQAHILQQMMQVKNAQTIDTLRQAQAQNLQLVQRQLPDGSVIEIPQGHVGTFDAAMARAQLANQKPDLNDMIGRAIANAYQRGVDPNQDPVVKQLLQVHQGMQKPPSDTAATQKADFMQGIQPMIQAGEFTPDMQTDVRKLVAGIQRSRAIPTAQKPALISYLTATSTPPSQETQATLRIQQEGNQSDRDIETAAHALVDPKNLTALKDIASLRGDQRLKIFARAKEIDPNFDPGVTNQRVRFLESYEDPKGRAAINRQSINNILQHAGDLSDLNEQYRRTDVRVINTPLNAIANQFGNEAYTRFSTTNSVLKDELSLYFAGGYAPTEAQRKMWDKIQSDTATPAQTEAFAKEVIHLGLRRANTFDSQFKTNLGYPDPNMITPEARNAAERLGLGNEVSQFGSGGGIGRGAPSGFAPPTSGFNWNSFPVAK